MGRTVSLGFAFVLVAAIGSAAAAAEPEYDPAPTSPIPPGWTELDLRLDTPGAAVTVDTAQFCGLPCRMLLAPGDHAFTLSAPGLDPRDLTRTFAEGDSLLLAGGLAHESHDGWGIALYVVGAAAILTAVGLVAYDVAINVGYAKNDWTKSYVASALAPLGLFLAIWGAVRGSNVETAEPTETVLTP